MSFYFSSPIAKSSEASYFNTSTMVAWVPSILLDNTASWVKSGDSNTLAFGIAFKVLS